MRHLTSLRSLSLAFSVGMLSSVPAIAADKELLDILLANGAITAEQHAALLKKPELTKEDVNDVVVRLDRGGLNIASRDGAYAIKIGARLHADAALHSGDTPGVEAVDGTEIRRARVEMKGTIAHDWAWVAEADFADNDVAIKDFWLGYEGIDNVRIMAGHQKQPYSLAVEMSSNDMPFTERSIDNDLVIPFVDRAFGIRADSNGDHWFFSAGLFGESVEPNPNGDDEGWAAVGRFVYAPIIDDTRIVHLGMRAAYREPDAGSSAVRMRDETTHFSDLRIVNTGVIGNVDGVSLYGPEASVVLGPFSLTGEYNRARITRDGPADLDFDSWHVEATWTLTGESRAAAYRIDAGEFKRLTGARDFSLSGGGWGAWEVAARYATIDLNDGAFIGGEEDAFTAALNWYANTNVRLMFDYTHILDTDGSTALRRAAPGLDIYGMRVQYTF
ncbi:MAG: OprO/OprP family phosphate-selective porin [Gammaproteobacteria bacterium]